MNEVSNLSDATSALRFGDLDASGVCGLADRTLEWASSSEPNQMFVVGKATVARSVSRDRVVHYKLVL